MLFAAALFLGLSRLAAAEGVPIEFTGTSCPAYGPPDGPIGITDRYCYSFHAVAGEQVLGSCSASGVGPYGDAYPMSCTVLIAPAGADRAAVQGAHAVYHAPQSGEYVAKTVYFGRQTFFATEDFNLTQLSLPTCTSDATSLCLAGWRFRVTADWETADGRSGHGSAVALTDEGGSFTFFDPANIELVVKVHDACGLVDKWWVFAGGLTDVRVLLTVTDTRPGVVFEDVREPARRPVPADSGHGSPSLPLTPKQRNEP